MTGDAAHAEVSYDRIVAWELDVLGSHGMAAADYPAMLELVGGGRLDLASLVTRTRSLGEAIDSLVDPDGDGSGITVIDRFGP